MGLEAGFGVLAEATGSQRHLIPISSQMQTKQPDGRCVVPLFGYPNQIKRIVAQESCAKAGLREGKVYKASLRKRSPVSGATEPLDRPEIKPFPLPNNRISAFHYERGRRALLVIAPGALDAHLHPAQHIFPA